MSEDNVARYLEVGGAVAFDSDSSSYETALRYFEAVGKEVVICTNSFISVPNSVVTAGAKAVFADIKANLSGMLDRWISENHDPFYSLNTTTRSGAIIT